MLLNQTTIDQIDLWQTQIDLALEAGQNPTLAIVAAESGLDGLAALLAYESLIANRPDMFAPLVIFGGASPLWLMPLLDVQYAEHPFAAPLIVHAGVDDASEVAATTIFDVTSTRPALRRLLPAVADLELGFHPHIVPTALPVRPVRWSALPFAVNGYEATVTPFSDGAEGEFSAINWGWRGCIVLGHLSCALYPDSVSLMKSAPSATISALLVTLSAAVSLILIVVDRAGIFPVLQQVTTAFYRWIALFGVAALLLGALNLIRVHVRRIQQGAASWIHSLALVTMMGIVIGGGLANPEGVRSALVVWILDHVIFPGQATLFALLVFFMAAAGYRLLRIGRPGGAWMLAGTVLVLLTQAPFADELWPSLLRTFTLWLVDEPVMAAARGALLGASVALLVAGLHYAFGRR